jgi:hypothetical protein
MGFSQCKPVLAVVLDWLRACQTAQRLSSGGKTTFKNGPSQPKASASGVGTSNFGYARISAKADARKKMGKS